MLYFSVACSHLVDEAGFADVGEACDEERASVGVDGGQAGQMLSDLLQVRQGLALPPHNCAHPATHTHTSVQTHKHTSVQTHTQAYS